MKLTTFLAASLLTAGLALPLTAHAAPQGAKQFKNAMQNASQARLNNNGSTVLRFEADQDVTMTNTSALNSSVRANALTVDDSLISNLDTDQDATLRQVSTVNSTLVLNNVDMTRTRSINTEIDQEATVRTMNAVNSTIAANTISIR